MSTKRSNNASMGTSIRKDGTKCHSIKTKVKSSVTNKLERVSNKKSKRRRNPFVVCQDCRCEHRDSDGNYFWHCGNRPRRKRGFYISFSNWDQKPGTFINRIG